MRKEEFTEAIQWISNPQTLMGVAPGDCSHKMLQIGIQKEATQKIRKQTEQWMLEEYHKDAKRKEHTCQKETEKRRRQQNKIKIEQLKAEKERRRQSRGTSKASLKKRRREIAKNMKSKIESRQRKIVRTKKARIEVPVTDGNTKKRHSKEESQA